MMHIFGFERSQLLLLPEAVDDYVVADNPGRFIDAFVAPRRTPFPRDNKELTLADGLDLAAAGFKRVSRGP
jgi:hypothetical protein